jgi:hypothetical protein
MLKSTRHEEKVSVAPAKHCCRRGFPLLRCDKIGQVKTSVQAEEECDPALMYCVVLLDGIGLGAASVDGDPGREITALSNVRAVFHSGR